MVGTKKKLFFLFLIGLLYWGRAIGQNCDLREDTTGQKDIPDVFRSVFKKDSLSFIHKLSIKAGRLYFSIIPGAGYTVFQKLGTVVSTNYAFYSDTLNTNLSVIKFVPLYTSSGELILPLKANIWTPQNKYNVTGDFRYYKYPETTYGLGAHTARNNSQDLSYHYFSLRMALLKHLSDQFFVGFGYNLDYHANIAKTDSAGQGVPDYENYNAGTNSSRSIGPSLNLLFDNRKNSINPQGGFYCNFIYRTNFVFLGSSNNWQSIILDIRKYIRLSAHSKNIISLWAYTWLSVGSPPYLDLPATGWDSYSNLGRGYIQGRYRGKDLLYLETEYRFGITKNGLLGGVVFANVQTFSEWPGGGFETLLPAVGTGLRIKLNKLSNTNVAIDYGIGISGYGGIFVNLGEAF